MLIVSCPLDVTLPRVRVKDKKYIINLNNYRNWHYLVSNQIKQTFAQAIAPFLGAQAFPSPCMLVFNYYPPTARMVDVENPCSIICKFFSDAAIEYGCLTDDNHQNVPAILHLYREVDRVNPRCDVMVLNREDAPSSVYDLLIQILR